MRVVAKQKLQSLALHEIESRPRAVYHIWLVLHVQADRLHHMTIYYMPYVQVDGVTLRLLGEDSMACTH